MAIKTNVRKHTRKVGKRKITVKKHRRKIKGGKPNITKKQRALFDKMATLPYEVGGQLDFEGKRLENVKTHFGSNSALEFDWDPDYEIGYHTHPTGKQYSIMPSFHDLQSMKQTNEKEQIILNNKIALSIGEERKFRRTPIQKMRKVNKQMQRDFQKGMSDKRLYLKYKPILRKELGLVMKWHGPKKAINLHSRSV